ncbi:hypothetical protein, partial [Lysinibacillus sp. fls2-241-R2A-57]
KAKRQRQMFYLRESEASATIVLSVAKAKRQLQSSHPERKSTPLFGDEFAFFCFYTNLLIL